MRDIEGFAGYKYLNLRLLPLWAASQRDVEGRCDGTKQATDYSSCQTALPVAGADDLRSIGRAVGGVAAGWLLLMATKQLAFPSRFG